METTHPLCTLYNGMGWTFVNWPFFYYTHGTSSPTSVFSTLLSFVYLVSISSSTSYTRQCAVKYTSYTLYPTQCLLWNFFEPFFFLLSKHCSCGCNNPSSLKLQQTHFRHFGYTGTSYDVSRCSIKIPQRKPWNFGKPNRSKKKQKYWLDETTVDKMTADKMVVDKTGVEKLGCYSTLTTPTTALSDIAECIHW